MKIKDLPVEIQKKVKEYKDGDYNTLCLAFTWGDTPEGHKFWSNINNGDFTDFYKKYPKKKVYDINDVLLLLDKKDTFYRDYSVLSILRYTSAADTITYTSQEWQSGRTVSTTKFLQEVNNGIITIKENKPKFKIGDNVFITKDNNPLFCIPTHIHNVFENSVRVTFNYVSLYKYSLNGLCLTSSGYTLLTEEEFILHKEKNW